jgi:signal transduction histidine kinase
MPGIATFATVSGMHDGDVISGDVDGDLELPLVHRLARRHYSPAQLVAIDVAAVALLSIVSLFLLPQQTHKEIGGVWNAVAWAVGIGAGIGVLFRHRFPQAALVFVLPCVLAGQCLRSSGAIIFFLVMVTYSAVAVSSRRRALVIMVVVAGAAQGATIVGGGNQVIASAIAVVALVVAGWLAGENTRASRAYAAQRAERLAEKAAAVEAERSGLVRRAVADERVQIARELHDIVAHAMSVIAVRSGAARMVVDTQPDQAREALTIIETTTRRSLQEMRLLVGVLRDDDDDHADLAPVPGLDDLGRLVADIENAGVDVDLAVMGQVHPLPPAADLSAYRIVQEALTNVVRHAGPTRARVQITYRPDEVGIEVADDGPSGQGVRPAVSRAGGGHGLIGMRERAALFGGDLVAGPVAQGFCVRANLHLNAIRLAAPYPSSA